MVIRGYLRVIALATLSLVAGIQADTATQYNTKNTDIVWDVDGVMLKKPSVRKKLWKHKKALLWGAFNLKLLYRLARSESKETAEEWAAFFDKQGKTDLAAMVRDIGYNKTPMKDTVQIIKELKTKGYTQHVATNMGSQDFAYFKKKYSFFKIFKYANTVDYKNGDKFKKPDARYFEQYYGRNKHNKEHQIFIDDRKSNVEAARKVGMTAIHFKNARQLREDLAKLGIL